MAAKVVNIPVVDTGTNGGSTAGSTLSFQEYMEYKQELSRVHGVQAAPRRIRFWISKCQSGSRTCPSGIGPN